ncbi:TetR/AcrR family transcriptional regulator [Paraferrimonas haliotis]|uniref:TetR family transcriptional regulator n=1 Tax=Paraferrimonas haliotis TaxID=2013866 RepID=A0AA37TME9_9GAMM|nr:TetR/AcrR family transcriptional regulator [Paraferrimonas haliotis]GLS82328.1 TetR family transcriptional regulator [Paraferrimonas haliotis]
MAQRKQGRRSAQEAEQTKLDILTSAAVLFCEKGYNQVSIRDISEKAGVTHSLIRHYFGPKEQVWRAIIDEIHSFVNGYGKALEDAISPSLTNNQRLYRYLCHFMAFMLMKPQLCQIMLDYIHHPQNEGEGEQAYSAHILELVDKAFTDMPDLITELADNPGQLMWRFLIHSGGAVAFRPFMGSAWPQMSDEQALLEHWKLYEQDVAQQFDITEEQRLPALTLAQLVPEVAGFTDCDKFFVR